jgi:Tfp pilus assembly protein PilF
MRAFVRGLAVIITASALLVSCTHTPGGNGALTASENLSLAVIYESRGEIDLALKHFGLAIESDKRNPEAYFALANLNLKIRRYAEAESAYKKAIRLSPSSGPFYNNLGWLYMETGRLSKAAAAVALAIKRDRTGRHVYYDTLGVIQMKGSRYGRAEKTFKSALELTPPEDDASRRIIYGHLLDLYEAAGRGAEAEALKERMKGIH